MSMVIEKHVGIEMPDGVVLRANVFRPLASGRYPVIMSFGVYGKDVHFEDAFNPQWQVLKRIYPGLDRDGSSGRWLRWEMPDPERWIPDGFVVVTVDGRGSGMSPGYLDPFSPQETRDFYECIEWAGLQPWSNGKVGLLGVSYLAIKQWQVAALRPPHLAAIVPWEGAWDSYRDRGRHGGILSDSFTRAWWPRQILSNQHGSGQTSHRDRDTGERTTGPALPSEMLAGNTHNVPDEMLRHVLCDAWVAERTPRMDRIEVPVLSAANWGGPGLHLRGNIEAFDAVSSRHKWLFAHIGTHYESFYLPHYVALQKRFFSRFLRDEPNGFEHEPPVQLAIRQADGTAQLRQEHEWPLARTQWTPLYLNASTLGLQLVAASDTAQVTFDAMGEGLTFRLPPFEHEIEFTGPVSLRLWVSSTTNDVDVFAVVRVFDPEGRECTFVGAHEPVAVAYGWLRASHRKLDAQRSLPGRPWHPHDELQPLVPGEVVPLDVEIWPTSLVCPPGYTLALTVRGNDFVVAAPGRLRHDNPADRPAEVFAGRTTLHTGGPYDAHLLLPVIPPARAAGLPESVSGTSVPSSPASP
jgi:predicted acyl esterase